MRSKCFVQIIDTLVWPDSGVEMSLNDNTVQTRKIFFLKLRLAYSGVCVSLEDKHLFFVSIPAKSRWT
jgi:hypothetical protein